MSVPPSQLPTGRRAEALDRRHIERRDLIARRLLPAVERLLEHETYQGLTVDQMAAEADISRSTFYNYFEGKHDLMHALTGDVMSMIVDATRMWWMLPPSRSRAELQVALRHLLEMYSPHLLLMRAVAESIWHDAQIRDEFMNWMNNGRDGIASYIRSGQEAGVFRPELDATAAAQWLTWMLERGLSQMSLPADGYEPERILEAVVDVLWKALH